MPVCDGAGVQRIGLSPESGRANASHVRKGMERMEPGGSAYNGASQDLRCSAMLVAQISRPMHRSSVSRSTRLFDCQFLTLLDISWIESWEKLISHPHRTRQSWNCAFLPGHWRCNCAEEKHNQSEHFLGTVAHECAQKGRLCVVSKPRAPSALPPEG